MARDYAKKTGKKQQTIDTPSKLMWFIAFMLIAIFVLGLYYLHNMNHNTHAQPAKLAPVIKGHVSKKTQNPIKFEFYTSLPNAENAEPTTVEHQQAAHEKEAPVIDETHKQNEPGHAANKDHNTYVLQVASFKNYKDADDLKAKLLMAGYNASVQEAKVKDTSWYRVLVGTYTDLNIVKTTQAKLAEQHISTLLLEMNN